MKVVVLGGDVPGPKGSWNGIPLLQMLVVGLHVTHLALIGM